MRDMQSWVIEYSHSTKRFHIDRANDMLRRNILSVHSGNDMDYICVGIFPTKAQAEDAIMEFRRQRNAWQTLAFF